MKISDYVESQIKGLWGTDFDENGIPVIKTNNLTYEGHIDYSDICKRNITREHAKECYLKPGDLLIEKSGGTKTHSVGYVSYFEGDENKFVCNNFILALRLKNTINSKFLFYQIQFKYESNQFSDCFNKTTGIQNLKVKDYLAKEIKIYSPEEQEKIVKELDTVRSTINKNKQILEKYDTLIKSRFIEMFGKIIDDSTKIPLEELCDFVTVGIANSATHAFCDEGVVMFRNQNIKEDFLDDSDIIHINTDFANKYKTKALKENDLLIVRTGYPGICCLVPKKYEGCQTFTTLIARLKKDENVNPKFICHYINSDYGREYVNKNQAGVAQQNFGATALSKMPMSIPPLSLQNDFASFVQQIDKSKFAVQKSLEKAETLYKSLMQEYFA